MGKITFIKTLIMPKLTHLLISLPDPEDYFLKYMNTLFYKFIWQNRPKKLKHDLMTQCYKDVGSKMINIHNFKTSFKCTGLRSLFLCNSKCVSLFHSVTDITAKNLNCFLLYTLIFRSNQWSTTGLSKAVVCTVLSMEKCNKRSLAAYRKE